MGGFFNKKPSSLEIPPDIGQESGVEEAYVLPLDKLKESENSLSSIEDSSKQRVISSDSSNNSIELARLNAKFESLLSWIHQFYEKVSLLNEALGELRASTIANEKRISESTSESQKAVDIVKEVAPERIRADYQKLDLRLSSFEQEVSRVKEMFEELSGDLKDLKKRADVFIGTEALVKLNEDTKKELVEMQKISNSTKLNADKTQELFIEVRKGLADSQKAAALINNFEQEFSDLRKETTRFKIEMDDIIGRREYLTFKADIYQMIRELEKKLLKIDEFDKRNESIKKMVEASFATAKSNEEKLDRFLASVGKDTSEVISTNANKFDELLALVEKLSAEVVELKSNQTKETKLKKKVNLSR